jgi:hypothetical protein
MRVTLVMVTLLLRESARPTAIREHPLAPWFAVATVCFGAFMGLLAASTSAGTLAISSLSGLGLPAGAVAALAAVALAGVWCGRAGARAGRQTAGAR